MRTHSLRTWFFSFLPCTHIFKDPSVHSVVASYTHSFHVCCLVPSSSCLVLGAWFVACRKRRGSSVAHNVRAYLVYMTIRSGILKKKMFIGTTQDNIYLTQLPSLKPPPDFVLKGPISWHMVIWLVYG